MDFAALCFMCSFMARVVRDWDANKGQERKGEEIVRDMMGAVINVVEHHRWIPVDDEMPARLFDLLGLQRLLPHLKRRRWLLRGDR